MRDFENWLDNIIEAGISPEIIAVNFNLYEDENNSWSIEFVGTDSFDADDSDWACAEVFVTRDAPLSWIQETSWETILAAVINDINTYLNFGKYAEKLKSYAGIGVGFVDGDISIIYQK